MPPNHRPHPPFSGGFTIIELMTVVAIIALMIGIAVPAVMMARKAAAVATANKQMAAIQTGISAFFNDFGEYPPSSTKQIEATSKLKGLSISGKGARMIYILMTGYGSSRGQIRQEPGFKIRGKTYGPYVQINDPEQVGDYMFQAPWKTPIDYWRANRGIKPTSTNLRIWGGGSSFRFDYSHGTKNPAYDRLGINNPKSIRHSDPKMEEHLRTRARQLGSQLQASEFILFNTGPDTETGTDETRTDDLMLSGR